MAATIQEHAEAVHEMTVNGTGDRIVRIAVREIREYAFRAMVAHGACTSVAHAAAHQVLFAQVHYGTGFAALLDCLEHARVDDAALRFERTATQNGLLYTIAGTRGCEPLVHGTMLVELATAGAENLVIAPDMDLDAGLLDAPLVAAASRCGKTVLAANLPHHGKNHHGTRIATPAGYVGQVRVPAAAFDPVADLQAGTLIRTLDEVPDDNFALHTPEELQQRRENAWAIGLPVDGRLWKTVKTAAENYLVGDTHA